MSITDFNSIVKALTGKSIADFAQDQVDGKPEHEVMAEVSAYIERESESDTLKDAYYEMKFGISGPQQEETSREHKNVQS